jgi:hypothetical protein
VFSVLLTGPKGCRFKPGRGDGFLRAIKIRSTLYVGWEVKQEVPCRKILWHVKILLDVSQLLNTKILIPSSIPPSRSRCLCW